MEQNQNGIERKEKKEEQKGEIGGMKETNEGNKKRFKREELAMNIGI